MPTLNWLTRDDDLRAASRVPYRLLEEAPELSAGVPMQRITTPHMIPPMAHVPFRPNEIKGRSRMRIQGLRCHKVKDILL